MAEIGVSLITPFNDSVWIAEMIW